MGVDMDELATYPLFAGMAPMELALMRGCLGMHPRDFGRGEVIYLAEEQVMHVGVVLSGSVRMVSEDEEGGRILLAHMGVGELMGETFACGALRHSSATFVAGTEGTRVLFLAFDRVLHTCNRGCGFHRRLVDNLVRLVCAKNVQLMERVEVASRRTLREKVLTYLRIQRQRQGSDVVRVPLTRTELAAYLSANRSALAREMGRMEDEGLIQVRRDEFRLL